MTTYSIGATVIENGIEYKVVRKMEWGEETDYELYSAQTGETRHIRIVE